MINDFVSYGDSTFALTTDGAYIFTSKKSTGIDEVKPALANNVVLYPDPATDFINLRFTTLQGTAITLTIYNAEGKQLKTETTAIENGGVNTIRINISDLPEGIYLYQLHQGESTTCGRFAVIKNR